MRALFILSLIFLIISNLIFAPLSYATYGVKQTPLESSELAFRFYREEPALNLSRVYVAYSNIFVIERKDSSNCISFMLRGPYKQTGWLVLISPWKPFRITSNNTDQPFVELEYDPRTMKPNPITNTDHSYAWDYDAENHVVFIKFLLTSNITITVCYGIYAPKISEFTSRKISYTTLEEVSLSLSIYGNYTVPTTINWLSKLTIKDAAGNLVQTIDRTFKLSKDEIQKLQYDLGTFKQGTYTATAQVIDPTTEDVLASSHLTFNVTTAPYIPPGIPPWIIWILIISVITAIGAAAYLYYRRTKAAPK